MTRMGLRIVSICATAATAATLGACGSDGTEGAGTSTTITIAPTSYVTRQPVSTTTTPPTGQPKPPKETGNGDGNGGGAPRATGEQLYTVQEGDGPAVIAAKYDIELQLLVNYNQWPEGIEHPLFVGDIVKIPPNALVVPEDGNGGVTTDPPTEISEPATPPDTDPPSDTRGSTRPTRTTPPDNCEPGTYTIQASDTTRIAVAEKFDVSVQELDAANANTDGYDAFYVGLDIIIPAADDC